jgi:hypothetical protein
MENEVDEQEMVGKYRWLDLVCSQAGPAPTVRHILMVIGKHMDTGGGNCFPSTRRLAMETGLRRETVMRCLQMAEADGWIVRRTRGHGGQGWKRHLYLPAIPANVVSQDNHLDQERGEPESPPSTERGYSESQKVVTLTHLSTPYTSPTTTPNDTPTPLAAAVEEFCRVVGTDFELRRQSVEEWVARMSEEYPGIDLASRIRRASEWWDSALSTGKRKKCKAPSQAIRVFFRDGKKSTQAPPDYQRLP